MTISQSLLSDLDREAVFTRSVLAAAPADRFDWKPHEKSMTLGELASHIAETPSWIEGMQKDTFDMGELADYRPFAARDSATLLAAFESNMAICRAVISGDDAFLQTRWRMTHGDQVLVDKPRHESIRSIAIHHLIQHRGQLLVYLRLLDVPVPQTYGPTADYPDWAPDVSPAPA